MKIYTIGYSGRTLDDMRRILNEADGALLDIRMSPRSRKPGFSEKRLREAFRDNYLWMPEFGNVNYSGGPVELGDPALGIEMIDAIQKDAIEDEWNGAIFLMCVCKDAATCHRHIVAELLREHGYTVEEWQD